MTKKVAIYAAAGTPGLKRLRMFAEGQGWQIVADLRDDATTSARPGPGFSYLCKLIAQGAVQIVLAETLLSMGSRVDDLLTLADALKVSDGTLLLLDDSIDTGTASGAAWLETLVALAVYRTQKRRLAAKAGQARARREGVNWGRPKLPEAQLQRVRIFLEGGNVSLRAISRATGVSVGRIALEKRNMKEAGRTAAPP